MTPDPELRRQPLPEYTPEEEVDLGRYWSAIARRWWLPALGLIVGALIGFAVSATTSRPYESRTIIYMGKPLPPGGGEQLQEPLTRLAIASEEIRGRAQIRSVATRVGVRPGVLRNAIELEEVRFRRGRQEAPVPVLRLIVHRLPARKAVDAGNLLAAAVVERLNAYPTVKLGTYERRLARASRELARVTERIANAEEQQRRLLADRTLPATEKLILLANLNNVLQFNEQRRAGLETSQLGLRDVIAIAEQIERAKVLQPATAQRESPPSRRTSAAIGAVIGLLIGLVAALLWAPVAAAVARRRTT